MGELAVAQEAGYPRAAQWGWVTVRAFKQLPGKAPHCTDLLMKNSSAWFVEDCCLLAAWQNRDFILEWILSLFSVLWAK